MISDETTVTTETSPTTADVSIVPTVATQWIILYSIGHKCVQIPEGIDWKLSPAATARGDSVHSVGFLGTFNSPSERKPKHKRTNKTKTKNCKSPVRSLFNSLNKNKNKKPNVNTKCNFPAQANNVTVPLQYLSLIHIWRCRRTG